MAENYEDKRFISMLSDYGFKVAFGNEQHSEFLRKALQALINSAIPIRKVKLIRNEVTAMTVESRGGLYDIVCEDEQGRVFIVEMQLFELRNMIHRAKFYAFHRFNAMVRKGRYRFNNLKRIYTISILAGKTYSTALYHQIGTLQNQQGELMDDQITHVVIELDKFQKTLEEIDTDLDKLLYTMKLTDTATESAQLPDFMREGWLEETLRELDKANMTPDQRADLEMTIAGNMSRKIAIEERIERETEKAKKEIEKVKNEVKRAEEEVEKVKNEVKRAEEESARTKEEVRRAEEESARAKEETVTKMIRKGYNLDEIAEITAVSLTTIEAIKQKISD